MQKIGLTREDFVKYRGYFFKMLEDTGSQELEDTSKGVKQKHDKSFKDILMEKEEMAKFLQQFIDVEAEALELEEQKNNYINRRFEKRESDIIYKIKKEETYILVEHQSRVDKRMPRRILEYCMGLMMAIERSGGKDDGTNPIIIPVVVYTGRERWTVDTNFSDTQKTNKTYEKYKINLNYKLIDINKYSKQQLLEKRTKFAYMMLLEKCKTREELKEQLIEIILVAQNKDVIEWIKQIIEYVFPEMLGEYKDKILSVLERGEMNYMQDLIERIKENEARIEKRLIRKGGIQTLFSIIKNMLQQDEDEEKIMRYTNAKKEDIEKVRKELEDEKA